MYKLLFVLLLFSCAASSDWTEKYENGDCEGEFINSTGDAAITCRTSPIIKKLVVERHQEEITPFGYSAKITITNSNTYPVRVLSFLLEALKRNQVVTFCGPSVDIELVPNQAQEVQVECRFLIENKAFDAVRVIASPWK